MNQIQGNLACVKERIAAAARVTGRESDSIKLVVVTKGQPTEAIKSVLATGNNCIGENRIQEAQEKYAQIRSDFNTSSNIEMGEWHLVGHLQRNKVKFALDIFSLIHSVDSLRLLAEIEHRAGIQGQKADVLIQVNTTGEESKFGVNPNEVLEFIEKSQIYSGVQILGLMTMGKLSTLPDENRPAFALLRTISEKINTQKYTGVSMQYLSMGMTNDFEAAIQEGANIVRIGRAIFGETA